MSDIFRNISEIFFMPQNRYRHKQKVHAPASGTTSTKHNIIRRINLTTTRMNDIYHSKDVFEFTAVAVEVCKRLENAASLNRKEFISSMLKLLPLLYLKSQIVLHFNNESDVYLEHVVTEDDYNAIRYSIADKLGEYDDYLDVFLEDRKYSDSPIHRTVSEDLADIYQELRDFLHIYEQDFEESTAAALGELSDTFAQRWGQTVVNVLRPLHETMYNSDLKEQEYQ